MELCGLHERGRHRCCCVLNRLEKGSQVQGKSLPVQTLLPLAAVAGRYPSSAGGMLERLFTDLIIT